MISRVRRWITAALTSLAVIAASMVAASPAQATDWYGDGDPSGCANPYTVKSAPIYGTRGPTAGQLIGYVEIRWSWSCYANWTRVIVLGSRSYSNTVTVEEGIRAEGRSAISVDNVRPGTAGTSAWTRYLRLRDSGSPACAYASLSSDFGTLNFHTVGASVCA